MIYELIHKLKAFYPTRSTAYHHAVAHEILSLLAENGVGVSDSCEKHGVSPHVRKRNASGEVRKVLIDFVNHVNDKGQTDTWIPDVESEVDEYLKSVGT